MQASKILLTEKLKNAALVTPNPGLWAYGDFKPWYWCHHMKPWMIYTKLSENCVHNSFDVMYSPRWLLPRYNLLVYFLLQVCKCLTQIMFKHPYICHIFPCLCTWCGCTIIFWQFHIYPRTVGSCDFHYCAVLWCVQIMKYIMAPWSYVFVCTLHYFFIIIIQTYLKVLNF